MVYETFGQDVLGDDAIFKTAEVYDKYLKQPDQAKKFYEELILKYPGSTYVQIARMKITAGTAPSL
jgi:TolA-binding protein